MSADWFIYCLMALNAGAFVAFAFEGQYIKALYWASVVVLNFCILRLK